jgi:hypothetical protein
VEKSSGGAARSKTEGEAVKKRKNNGKFIFPNEEG